MEWRQADVFQFTEQYKDKKLLWDATVDDFKNRNKRQDAWAELDDKFAVAAGESEKKIRKLISQFNRECKKVYKSGRGAEDNAKWIYFKSLLFLKDKNKPRTAMDGGLYDEEHSLTSTADETQVDEIIPETEGGDVASVSDVPLSLPSPSIAGTARSESRPLKSTSQSPPVSARDRAPKRKNNADAMANEAFMLMRGMANRPIRDEFGAYGETVAMTLRKLNNISATHTKHVFNAPFSQ